MLADSAVDVVSLDDEPSPPPYAESCLEWINEAVTNFHGVDIAKRKLSAVGYVELKESQDWVSRLKLGGKYYVTRNGTSLIAFTIGGRYEPGNPIVLIGTHIDSLTWKLRPISKRSSDGGFIRLGVVPYAGGGASKSYDASHTTWWDRDLGIGGRVLVKGKDGKVSQRVVKLSGPAARIASLGKDPEGRGPFNYETNMVPIIGLTKTPEEDGSFGKITEQHNALLLERVACALDIEVSQIADLDLELYDYQPATLLGLDQELFSAPRLDDKLCSYTALEALLNVSQDDDFLSTSGTVSMIGFFDNEESGSHLRQGAQSNFSETVIRRIVEAQVGIKMSQKSPYTQNLMGQTMGTSYFVSADVQNGLNPDFIDSGIYIEGAVPVLNKGICIAVDPGADMTSDASSISIARIFADKIGHEVQWFQNTNDTGGGGTIGPMVSQRLGCRAIDVGLPHLSMHSIRGITGAADPGLGVHFFEGCFRHYDWARTKVLFQ
ncbi:peptidase M18, aminopeptidase I [Sistotremastrum niveocremeum HHB9708]|uniref:Peptidase M18, aminopeptidase I n=1 Tax=Sistotremastrum niveocremeum HHB9708 TaxID=1314777 RepID=A0A164QXA5_9AGAM|nr:peptidase M18, aminopeptidase I [Sistotremastrum niveocremeum HHB9708]